MNAAALKFDSPSRPSLGRETAGHWRVVGQFATVEAAEAAAARFGRTGGQSCVTMIDGVTLMHRD